MNSLGVLLILSLVSSAICARPSKSCTSGKYYYKVEYDSKTNWTVSNGTSPNSVATAVFCPEMNITGWDILEITTSTKFSDEMQAFAAGFIEGAVTYESIWNSLRTGNLSYGGQALPQNVQDFIVSQDSWMKSQAAANKQSSPYWYHVSLVLAQLDGLTKGYAQYAPKDKNLGYIDFLVSNLGPEIGDIFSHFQSKGELSKSEKKPIPGATHCSVLVKVSQNGQHLLSAHDTWSGYSTMLRQFKTYNFHFRQSSPSSARHISEIPEIPGSRVAFSSYPGSLQSGDDYYMTNSQLIVMETTNDVMNDTLYKLYISTQTVSEWIRIIIANRLATGGRAWASIYSQFNSGTYNNQWQVVDYKLFTPGKPLLPNTLWIVEQIPGYVVSADKTDVLVSQGYWPSYNIPYFPFIYNISGYPAYFQQYGNTYSYQYCARANIFRRDQHTVQDIPTLKKIMRYNKFQSDELSLKDACRGISARCDLNTPWNSNGTLNGWSAFGGIDSKLADENSMKLQQTEAINGPTWDSQPPFAWTDTWNSVVHLGQPTVFDFDWVTVTPTQ